MKVTDPQQPVSGPDVKSDDESDVPKTADSDESSAFSQVLAKKKEGGEENAETRGGKSAEKPFDPAAAGLVQAPAMPDQQIQVGQVESKRLVAMPPEVQQLVREISVVVNAAGKQQVHIELNSNVMHGLQIRIERQQGAIAIQFQSSSDDVTRLLLRNADALTQGLADRGLRVADIRVTGPKESTRAHTNRYRTASGLPQGRGQGGKR